MIMHKMFLLLNVQEKAHTVMCTIRMYVTVMLAPQDFFKFVFIVASRLRLFQLLLLFNNMYKQKYNTFAYYRTNNTSAPNCCQGKNAIYFYHIRHNTHRIYSTILCALCIKYISFIICICVVEMNITVQEIGFGLVEIKKKLLSK